MLILPWWLVRITQGWRKAVIKDEMPKSRRVIWERIMKMKINQDLMIWKGIKS
ncbi:lactate dehydrogenase [Sesbania bispinosa]|nr:lactate dehydrogenase [Sesbania bispinosa]